MAFASVVYLLLEERAYRRAGGRHLHRPVDETVKNPSYQPTTTKWYKRIFGMGFRGRKDRTRDTGSSLREQGWIQAGTTDEWESDSGEDFSKPGALTYPSKESNPSLDTKRTSAASSLPRRSLVYSFVSDRSSVLPSDLPVLPYEDPHAPSIRYSIPSIYSQLRPPSLGSVSDPAHQPNCTISTISTTPVRILSSPRMPSSPVSIEHAPFELPDNSDPVETLPHKPSLRTFEGGTKFIEAL